MKIPICIIRTPNNKKYCLHVVSNHKEWLRIILFEYIPFLKITSESSLWHGQKVCLFTCLSMTLTPLLFPWIFSIPRYHPENTSLRIPIHVSIFITHYLAHSTTLFVVNVFFFIFCLTPSLLQDCDLNLVYSFEQTFSSFGVS